MNDKFFRSWLPLLICFGGILAGYDTGVIGSALLSLKTQFYLADFFQGIFASCIILGIMIGVMIASIASDRYRHRSVIFIAALIYITGVTITILSLSVALLFFGRIFTGVAIGIILVITPLYLAEISAPTLRGRFIATFQLAITLGIFLGYFSSYCFAYWGSWRWMFLGGMPWAIFLLLATFYLPDTVAHTKNNRSDFSWKKMLCREYFRPFTIGLGLAILQQVTGINAIFYFAPQILLSVHHQPATSAIYSSLIIAAGNFLFTIMALFILDSIGRRPVLMISLIFQSISLVLLALSSIGFLPSYPFLFVCYLLIYLLGFAIGLGPVTWLIIAEIYPAMIRGKAIGLSVMINNIAAFMVASSFLYVLHKVGVANIFWLFALISFAGLLFVWRCVPETRQSSLAEIEMRFKKIR